MYDIREFEILARGLTPRLHGRRRIVADDMDRRRGAGHHARLWICETDDARSR